MNEIEKNKYQSYKTEIHIKLQQSAVNFFNIGYMLRKINDQALYMVDGYTNIWDFSKAEYGLSKSTTSRFMAINERFGIGDGLRMNEQFLNFGPSKLQEMLTLPDEELQKVTEETSVREIRALKEEAKNREAAEKQEAAKQEEKERRERIHQENEAHLKRMQEEKEREKKRHNATEKELRWFYDYHDYDKKPLSFLTSENLKRTLRTSGYSGMTQSFDCDNGFIRINNSKKITYIALAAIFREFWNKKNTEAAEVKDSKDEVIDAEFRDIQEEQKETERPKATKEAPKALAPKELKEMTEEELIQKATESVGYKYSMLEVREEIITVRKELEYFVDRTKQGVSTKGIMRRTILLDALILLQDKMGEDSLKERMEEAG